MVSTRRKFAGPQQIIAGLRVRRRSKAGLTGADLEIELLVVVIVAGDHDQLVTQCRPDLPRAVLGDEADHADHLVHVGARTLQREERRGLDRFEDDVEAFRPAMPVDLRDVGIRYARNRCASLLAQRTLHLRPLQGEHGPQLGCRDPSIARAAARSAPADRPSSFRARMLFSRGNCRMLLIPIAGLGIDMGGLQQFELVVEPQLTARDLRDTGRIHRSGTSRTLQLAMKACRSRVHADPARSARCRAKASGYSIGFDRAMPSDVAFPIANGTGISGRAVQHQGGAPSQRRVRGGNRFWRKGIDATHRPRRHWPASPSQASESIISCHVTALVDGRFGVEEHVPEQAGETRPCDRLARPA